MEDHQKNDMAQPLHLTEPAINWSIDDGVVNAVIASAVWAVGHHPGVWSKVMTALDRGVRKTEKGTIDAFLFQAMVDRLLEEYFLLYLEETGAV